MHMHTCTCTHAHVRVRVPRSVQLVWWLTHTARYDEFRMWTLEVCADPWQQETVSTTQPLPRGLHLGLAAHQAKIEPHCPSASAIPPSLTHGPMALRCCARLLVARGSPAS